VISPAFLDFHSGISQAQALRARDFPRCIISRARRMTFPGARAHGPPGALHDFQAPARKLPPLSSPFQWRRAGLSMPSPRIIDNFPKSEMWYGEGSTAPNTSEEQQDKCQRV
jgi:hypothetical protein